MKDKRWWTVEYAATTARNMYLRGVTQDGNYDLHYVDYKDMYILRQHLGKGQYIQIPLDRNDVEMRKT